MLAKVDENVNSVHLHPSMVVPTGITTGPPESEQHIHLRSMSGSTSHICAHSFALIFCRWPNVLRYNDYMSVAWFGGVLESRAQEQKSCFLRLPCATQEYHYRKVWPRQWRKAGGCCPSKMVKRQPLELCSTFSCPTYFQNENTLCQTVPGWMELQILGLWLNHEQCAILCALHIYAHV